MRGCLVVATTIALVGVLAAPARADQWYAADMHVHSVAVSGDAYQDLGVLSQAAEQNGLNAVFLTDHSMGSNLPIAQAIANHVVFDPSQGMTYWDEATYGTLGSSTNTIGTSPTGTQALHLAATASGYGETYIWQKRGPDLRSGDLILKFSVYPVRIDSKSGVYVSVSIGGDNTLGKVPGSACDSSGGANRPPNGYTTAAGVISPYKYNRLVWQLGTPVTPSSVPDARVITNNLPYTLNQWNSYVIDVSNGQTTWNGSTVSGLGNGIQDIPAADQPMSYDALTQLKLTAAGNGGTADAYFGTYNLDASNPVQNGDQFVYRNSIVHTYDTSTFKIFPGLEAGTTSHVSRFNYDITSASQYQPYKLGTDSIAQTQATGYPSQIDHPGLPGGITQATLEANLGFGSDLMEAVPRGGNEIMLTEWDDLLKQNVPILGTWSTDAHRTEVFGLATFIYAPSLSFDPLIRALWEGRAFMANAGFPGRMAFNLDPSSSVPYPARYPVYVPAGPLTENVHLSISGGIPSGATVRWIQNGSILTTDSTSGSTYDKTKAISLSGSFSYVRGELRSSAGVLLAMTEPIFFETASSLPSSTAVHVDGVTTADGKGYVRTMTKGITQASYDATSGLSLTLVNLPGSLVESEASIGGVAPTSVTVDGTVAGVSATLAGFNAATMTTWFYDATAHVLHLKAVEGATGSTTAVVGFGAATDGQPPTTPTGVAAAATGSTTVHVSWKASSDNVRVAGYTVYRNGSQVARLGSSTLSYDDGNLTPSTTYSYTVDAFDSAGNHSPPSTAVTAKTLPPNQPPTAGNVSLTGQSGIAATWTPSVSDPDNNTLTCTIATQPAHGTASVSSDCSQGSYTAASTYTGSDSFTYRVSDGTASATGTVTVTVQPSNHPPTAADVTVSVQSGVAASWVPSVSDPDGDALTCSITTAPAHGIASVSADCSGGTYTATPGYVGTDSFSYAVSDGSLSATANVNVTVTAPPANRPPSGSAASVSTLQRVPVTVPLAASDPDGNCPLTFTPGAATRGSLSVVGGVSCSNGNATAQVTYTPNPPFVGTDSFTYTVRDPSGATSSPISRSITVKQSQPPVATAVSASTLQHTPVTITLAASDPDGTCPLTFIPAAPGRGSLSVVGNVNCSNGNATAQVTYTPNAPVLGTDAFTYTVRDPSSVLSAPATVTITIAAAPPSRPPVASSVSVSTMQRVPVVVPLAAVDPDGNCPLTFTPTAPSRGTIGAVTNVNCSNGSATAQITYTPNAPLVGSDGFTFTARDPSGATSTPASVSITVRASKPPVATAVTASTFQRIPVVLSLAATDPDGDCPLTFTPGAPGRGSLTAVTGVSCVNGVATAQVTYRPNPPVVGSDSFSYTVRDPSGAVSAAANATISITPTVFSDSFETGTLGLWTSSGGLAVETTVVAGGSYAAQANTTTGHAWAKKILPTTYTELTYRVAVRLHSVPTGLPLTMLSFRTAADLPIADLFVDGSGHVGLRNDITGVTTLSTSTISLDAWHTLAAHLKINGTAGTDNVTLDGTTITALSSATVNLGTNPIGALQIGEPAGGIPFNAFFDNIYATSP